MLPKRSLRILCAGAAILLFLPIWMKTPVVFLNLSPSVPRGVYLRVPRDEVRAGDCVAYLPTEEVAGIMRNLGWTGDDKEACPFLKYVGAIAGDRYTVSATSFFVNGEYIGEAVAEDSRGHALPLARGTHIVPEGEFLPVACSPKSFDGRHTGTVPVGRIVAKVIPLLVVD